MAIHTLLSVQKTSWVLDKEAIKYAFLSFLILRISTSLILMLASNLSPVNSCPPDHCNENQITTLYNQNPFSRAFLLPWYRFDSYHYLEIADNGYEGNVVKTVWPPFYPILTRITSLVFKPSILAALIVSSLASFLAFYLIFMMTNQRWGIRIAKHTLLILITFPTAFFLVAAYTETLFLAIILCFLLVIEKKKWLLGGILASLATLTRNQGIFLIVPMFFGMIYDFIKNSDRKISTIIKRGSSITLPLFSFLVFSLYIRLGLRYPWPWETLAAFWGQKVSWPWEGLIGNLVALITISERSFVPILALDLMSALIAIFLLSVGSKTIPATWLIYSWMMLMVSLMKVMNGSILMSTARYILVLFPIYIMLALNFKHKFTFIMYLAISSILQVLLLISFYLWWWVA